MACLSYDGHCAEALRFCARALGGKIELLVRGADTPRAAQISEAHAGRSVHGRLALPGGGQLTRPLQPMFRARIAGRVTDRFAVSWLVNGELARVTAPPRSRGRRWPTCC